MEFWEIITKLLKSEFYDKFAVFMERNASLPHPPTHTFLWVHSTHAVSCHLRVGLIRKILVIQAWDPKVGGTGNDGGDNNLGDGDGIDATDGSDSDDDSDNNGGIANDGGDNCDNGDGSQ